MSAHRTVQTASKGNAMPQYFFAIRAGAKDTEPERSVVLKDDAAAFDYACKLARELMQSDGSGDPSVLVKVRDNKRAMVFSIPLLAACA